MQVSKIKQLKKTFIFLCEMGLLAKNMQILADTDMLSNMPCAFANWFFTPFYMIYHFKFGDLYDFPLKFSKYSYCTKPGDQWFFFSVETTGVIVVICKKGISKCCVAGDLWGHMHAWIIQWNLSATTTSVIKFITSDWFSNVFQWRLKAPIYSC